MGKRKRIRGRASAAPKKQKRPKVAEAQQHGAPAPAISLDMAAPSAPTPAAPPTTTALKNGPIAASLSPPLDSAPPRPNRDERLPTQMQVQVRAVFQGTSLDEEVVNWSPGGVFVHTAQPLATGDPVVLTFPGGDDDRALALTGRVRWASPFGHTDDPRPGMGIEFVGITDPQRRRLALILRGHAHLPQVPAS